MTTNTILLPLGHVTTVKDIQFMFVRTETGDEFATAFIIKDGTIHPTCIGTEIVRSDNKEFADVGENYTELYSALSSELPVLQKKQPTVAPKKDKPDNVQIVRYVRPVGFENSNMFGVTLVFDLDYKARRVHVGMSICNGDNFEKEVGVGLALMGYNGIYNIPMPDNFDDEERPGIVPWFFERSPELIKKDSAVAMKVSQKFMNMAIDMYIQSDYC